MSQAQTPQPGDRGPMNRTAIALCIVTAIFLIPALLGVIKSFIKFARTIATDDGDSVVIIPMLSYLCMAAGFACLLVWAVAHGMFNDIEKPKFTLLKREAELDGQEGRTWSD